jgi:hypothetical protein
MRILSVAVVAMALLAGCQGGDRMAKASSVPASNGGVETTIGGPDPSPQLQCMDKCRAKAEAKNTKCLVDSTGAACSASFSEAMLKCDEKCTP